ncbi:serine O-acetyltransferase EpsC [Eubacterium xylanophilum]|uniref:serine O-acetyltransferase EpsC n=1 Tax=Eubacterium xylanophilum TaxID=39497 RepID=UPI00047E3D5F|nr:serine O-acetyltransferase EpsC [Eubacterium xylanophilum]
MNQKIRDNLENVVKNIVINYEEEPVFSARMGKSMPERKHIIDSIKDLRLILFPGYFGDQEEARTLPNYYVGDKLFTIYKTLCCQIAMALEYADDAPAREDNRLGDCIYSEKAETICSEVFAELPNVQRMLLKDVKAAYDGDPAANSMDEVIFSYPGLFAIYVYRIAHEFQIRNVPFIPRIMTEYAHAKTGIDIHAGAKIGESFFIDHGTGIVIGETTVIGNNVKIYQGVTLGGLSTRGGQKLSGTKRHPTIEDNVTIYSNASILGGETVIGANSVIGGNAFITESVPADSKIYK